MSAATWPERGELPDPELLRELRDAAVLAVGAQRAADITTDVDRVSGAPVLLGTVPEWSDVVRAGHAAGQRWAALRATPSRPPAVEVVVDLGAADARADAVTTTPTPLPMTTTGLPRQVDAIVVGAGICGLATARELTRHGARVAVLDAGVRIADGTTSWNNGMVHPGHDPGPETHKAGLNVAGNAAWSRLAEELGLPFERSGSLVAAFDDDLSRLDVMAERARANRVPGAEVVSGDAARELEPRLSGQVRAALWTPSTAVVNPWEVCLAMADDVRHHGGTVTLGAVVERLLVEDGRVVGVRCAGHDVLAPIVVNAAGVHADLLAATSGARRYSLHARRGTLTLFDPGVDNRHDISVGPVPGAFSKGGGMTARPDGLTTGGPTAVEQRSRVALPPTQDEMEAISALGQRLLPAFPLDAVVSVGSAVRAATFGEDFVVGAAPGVPGLVDVAGTQSPGVASAPAIADAVVAELGALGHLPRRPGAFTPRARREGFHRTWEER